MTRSSRRAEESATSSTSDFDKASNAFSTVSYIIYVFAGLTVLISIAVMIKIFRFHKRNNTWLYQYMLRGRTQGAAILPMNAAAGGTVTMMQYPFPVPGMQPYPGMGMAPQQGGFAMPMGAATGGYETQHAQDTGKPGYIPPGGYFPPPSQAYPVGMALGQMDPSQYAAAMMQNPQFVAAMQNAQHAAATMQMPQFAWAQPAAFPPADIGSNGMKK
ncbi:hypothetical protein PINS_up018229 [Pythium insidiosum]|nr:hypothetical protein PINS_up018229 [Pythium insidiosum]